MRYVKSHELHTIMLKNILDSDPSFCCYVYDYDG